MAASLRGSISKYISLSNPKISGAQFVFYRGITSKVFVKGIPFSTTEERLADVFSQFGKVVAANIIMDKLRRRSKGYGYVTFSAEDEAQKAFTDMNGKMLDGRVVFVDLARPSRHFNTDDVAMARRPHNPVADD